MRRSSGSGALDKITVSIHAPTRGATCTWHPVGALIPGFNPRTHSRCDHPCPSRCNRLYRFNPRTHSRCDIAAPSFADGLFVSIHAPTRGATFKLSKDLVYQRFQSTHPLEVRRNFFKRQDWHLKFQSTHPLEVRPLAAEYCAQGWLFQSTHPLEVRLTLFCLVRHVQRFQSTHPLEVRRLL